jgi:hypothetical protein
MTPIPPYALPPVLSPEFLILAFLRRGTADGRVDDWIPRLQQRFQSWTLSLTEEQFKEAVTRLGKAGFLRRDSDFDPPENGGPPERYRFSHSITEEGEQVLSKHLEILRAVLPAMGDE